MRLPIWYDGRLCRLSDNGTMLAIADGNAVRLWDVAKGREITQEVGHRSAIERIAVLPNSEEIGVADEFGGIRLWNTRSAQSVRRWGDRWDSCCGLVFSAKDKTLLAVTDSRIASCQEHGARLVSSNMGLARSCAVAPDGRVIVCETGSGVVSISSRLAQRNERIAKLSFDADADSPEIMATFAPDGRRFALVDSSAKEGWIWQWDFDTGRRLPKIGPLRACVCKSAYGPDGRLVAGLVSRRRAFQAVAEEVRIWEVASGQPCLELRMPGVRWRSVAFAQIVGG